MQVFPLQRAVVLGALSGRCPPQGLAPTTDSGSVLATGRLLMFLNLLARAAGFALCARCLA